MRKTLIFFCFCFASSLHRCRFVYYEIFGESYLLCAAAVATVTAATATTTVASSEDLIKIAANR